MLFAGDVVKLLAVGSGSSVVNNVFRVLFLSFHTIFAAVSHLLLFFRSLLCVV